MQTKSTNSRGANVRLTGVALLELRRRGKAFAIGGKDEPRPINLLHACPTSGLRESHLIPLEIEFTRALDSLRYHFKVDGLLGLRDSATFP